MNTDNFTYYNSETEAEAVVIPCRCCGQPMQTGAQEHWRTGDYYTLVTCDTRWCRMRGYTLSANGYENKSLDGYDANKIERIREQNEWEDYKENRQRKWGE